MRHSMKPDLRADYKIRLYTGPKNPFFEVSTLVATERRRARVRKQRDDWFAHRLSAVSA